MVLTGRDVQVVRDVADYQVLTREQLQRLGHFGSKTRANAVLARLTAHGYLSRRYQPAVAGTQRALYYPGPASGALLGRASPTLNSQRRRVQQLSDLFLAHQLLITDVCLCFRSARDLQVNRWMTEQALRTAALGVIPDGHVEYTYDVKRFGAFVEIDRGTETLDRFRDKVASYLGLAQSGKYRERFGRPYFRVLVVALSAERIAHLRDVTASQTDRIFWFTSHERLLVNGPLSQVWWRPVGSSLHALTES